VARATSCLKVSSNGGSEHSKESSSSGSKRGRGHARVVALAAVVETMVVATLVGVAVR
jgi:hypothetical protein